MCFLTSEDKSEISAKKLNYSSKHIHEAFPAVLPLSAASPRWKGR
ncbi:rCG54956 [Rattus norvegicus]|uniref:RCG54956 n=1 Tax=Rattus norvegicus TaxID=10116 RepID=A6III7_RAT|nr:rCG54956 [Rattus norvegicus]